MKTIVTLATILACALGLAACGGGGGDDSTVASNNSGGGSSQSAGTGTGSNGSSTGTGSGGSGTSTGSSSNSGTGAGSGSSSTGTGSSGSGTGTDSGGSGTSTGSGGDSSTGAGNNGSDTGSTGSNTLTYSYEAVTPGSNWVYAANVVSDVNTVAQTGYRWLSVMQENSSPSQGLYVKDSRSHRYAMALVLQPPDQATYDLSAAAFLDQLNFEGGQGYRYAGSKLLTLDATGALQNCNIYMKDTDSTATYSYILDASTVNNDSSNFLTQASGYGKSGYLYRGVVSTLSTLNLNMYEKDSTSNAYYTYQMLQNFFGDTDLTRWLEQANSQGAQGYRAIYLVSGVSGWLTYGEIFAKDTNQSATFTYQSVIDPETIESEGSPAGFLETNAGVVSQANTFGAQGYWFFANFSPNLIFVQPINCNNFQLCDPRTPQSV
jgi:hypothetical protein